MPITRAILISVVAYIATFILALAVALLLRNTDALTFSDAIAQVVWYGGAVVSIIIMALATWWYFSAPQARANLKHGAFFGLISIVVGFVLDVLSILPVGNPVEVLGDLYLQPMFFVSLAIIMATTTLTAYVLGRRHNARVPVVEEPKQDAPDVPMNDDIRDMAESDEFNA